MNRRAAPHRGIDQHYGDGDDARPSKTQLKKQSHDLQTLGVQLAELPDDRLAAIDMPDALRDALDEYRRTKSHEGRRRQMQYVGKLMRSADEAALREAVAAATLGSAQSALRLHEAERWRERLLADDDALTAWAGEHPGQDLQALRALVRQARKEAQPDAAPGQALRHGKAYRDLFRAVRAALDSKASDA
jgi:ribosome-associated protein